MAVVAVKAILSFHYKYTIVVGRESRPPGWKAIAITAEFLGTK